MHLEQLELRDQLDRRVRPELPGHREPLERKVYQEQLVILDLMVQLVLQVLQACQDLKD